MLATMSSQLTELELAVSTGNAQLNQLGFTVDTALPRILGIADDVRSVVESLKASLKTFMHGLINNLVNWRFGAGVETSASEST